MSAELVHPLGPTTVQDWLNETPPPDGSKRELILGKIYVSPAASGDHNIIVPELYALFKSALLLAGRRGLRPVTTVNAQLSSARRTALIPDVAIINTSSSAVVFTPDEFELVAEVWSPGNSNADRVRKFDAYAQASVRYFWTVEQDGPVVDAFELRAGRYRHAASLRAGTVGTITAAPVPVKFDPAELLTDDLF